MHRFKAFSIIQTSRKKGIFQLSFFLLVGQSHMYPSKMLVNNQKTESRNCIFSNRMATKEKDTQTFCILSMWSVWYLIGGYWITIWPKNVCIGDGGWLGACCVCRHIQKKNLVETIAYCITCVWMVSLCN